MPAKLAWTPWHEVVKLREDIRAGELSLSSFAADLYDVATGRAKPVHQDPSEFFGFTYPTLALRDLARDVVVRLAGKTDKAIRQLELTYGGGKTHSLITLYHLTRAPGALPDLPAVREFKSHIEIELPTARIAVLPFDKIDVEKGMETPAPDGTRRWLRQPWSVLAWQLAGTDGLRALHPDGADAERDTAPFQNLLETLLELPRREGMPALILIDEVLMYAHEKVRLDAGWEAALQTFFQCLTQAATKVSGTAVVASILATDPAKSDELGRRITKGLADILRREREEGIQPVQKHDVAEILRRRFFAPDSIRDPQTFREHVVAALKGIQELDDATKRDAKNAEERFLASYPFHPDLTEVLYSRWTQLDGFQRTRGVLRTFALALRDAEPWDESPLIGVNVFLRSPDEEGLSAAAQEMATIAATEQYEGKKHQWEMILQGELDKARDIQRVDVPSLRCREVEQAVVATFLHSQPIGNKAQTRDLMLLLGPSRPDRIDLGKGMIEWARRSWFLDETIVGENPDRGDLPPAWRLGTKPNLRQMHHDAVKQLQDQHELLESSLLDQIAKQKSLTAGATAIGARAHSLPTAPKDVEDDGEFHYAVLGPKAASESGKPSDDAKRFLAHTTGPEKPRVFRNAIVLVTPSRDGIELARRRVCELHAWELVDSRLKEELRKDELDPVRAATLRSSLDEARRRVSQAIEQAYTIVVTSSEKGDPQAFKITPEEGQSLFEQIRKDARARIQDTAITPETLLPGGPYELWREGETVRFAKDIIGAFAQLPQLPKMLSRRAIVDTLVQGCLEGRFVLRLQRPDRSIRTWWREAPDETSLKEPSLEVVLPEAAILEDVPPSVLRPGELPELWDDPPIRVGEVYEYFRGGKAVTVRREGYEEVLTVPAAPRTALDAALVDCVRDGSLWLTSGPASIYAEDVPPGVLSADADVQAPPPPIPVTELLPETLPEAWTDGRTTAFALSINLSKRAAKSLPWARVRDAVQAAISGRFVEVDELSGPWPSDYGHAKDVRLKLSTAEPPPGGPSPSPGTLTAGAELTAGEVQNLAETLPALIQAGVGLDISFEVLVRIKGSPEVPSAARDRLNELLADVSANLRLR
jgi:hypothetical protein